MAYGAPYVELTQMRTDPYRAGASIPVLMWVALGVALLLGLSRVPHVLVWLTVPKSNPVAVKESRAVPIEGTVYTFQSLQLQLPDKCVESAAVETEKLGPVLNLKECHPELRIFSVTKDDDLMIPVGDFLAGESVLERRRSFYAAPSRPLTWWMSYRDLRNYRREIGLISLMRSPGLQRVHIVTSNGMTVFVERLRPSQKCYCGMKWNRTDYALWSRAWESIYPTLRSLSLRVGYSWTLNSSRPRLTMLCIPRILTLAVPSRRLLSRRLHHNDLHPFTRRMPA